MRNISTFKTTSQAQSFTSFCLVSGGLVVLQSTDRHSVNTGFSASGDWRDSPVQFASPSNFEGMNCWAMVLSCATDATACSCSTLLTQPGPELLIMTLLINVTYNSNVKWFRSQYKNPFNILVSKFTPGSSWISPPYYCNSLLLQLIPWIHHPRTERSLLQGPSLFLYSLYLCLLVLISNLCVDVACLVAGWLPCATVRMSLSLVMIQHFCVLSCLLIKCLFLITSGIIKTNNNNNNIFALIFHLTHCRMIRTDDSKLL